MTPDREDSRSDDRRADRPYRPRRDDRPGSRDGRGRNDRDGRPHGGNGRGGHGKGRDGGRSDRPYRPRDGKGGDRRGDDRRKGSERPGKDDRPGSRGEDRGKEAKPAKEFTLTIPSTPQKILFKGVDCEVNGRRDLAMYLYLHGAVQLSGGCENNALRMLREMGADQFPTARGRVAKSCPEDALVAFDYLCSTLDDGYDRTFLRSSAEKGSGLAIYSLIRLGEVEGDSPLIDRFAEGARDNERMVEEGLKLLVRKKDSVSAEEHLRSLDQMRRLRQSVRPTFVKAMKGDAQSAERLGELAATFPEAAMLRDYLSAPDREAFLRENMPAHRDTIVSMSSELGISDTPFGRYLSAKKLQADGGEWVLPMIRAFEAGSDDALDDLRPVQTRRDVRKALSEIYLARGDAAGLVRCYDGEDSAYLDRYCSGDPHRTLEVASIMGGSRDLDWLKKGYREGIPECRDAILAMAQERRGKQMVYALHDVGADLEAARMYFDMYGDPALPAVKWLSKVCEDEETREYVRSRFEEMGDMRTYESIFVDDGYHRKGDRRGGRGQQRPRRR